MNRRWLWPIILLVSALLFLLYLRITNPPCVPLPPCDKADKMADCPKFKFNPCPEL